MHLGVEREDLSVASWVNPRYLMGSEGDGGTPRSMMGLGGKVGYPLLWSGGREVNPEMVMEKGKEEKEGMEEGTEESEEIEEMEEEESMEDWEAENAVPEEKLDEGDRHTVSVRALLGRFPQHPSMYMPAPIPIRSSISSTQTSTLPSKASNLLLPPSTTSLPAIAPLSLSSDLAAAPAGPDLPHSTPELHSLLTSEESRESRRVDERVDPAPTDDNTRLRLMDWETIHNNVWDSADLQQLQQLLKAERKVKIADSCYQSLEVWEQTCGGREFMFVGMLPFWSDEQAPERLKVLRDRVRKEYPFDQIREAAFQTLLQEEIREGIVSRVPPWFVKFLCPVFMVPKKGGKWRKVVDCRLLNEQQMYIHFRMQGPEVVQQIALLGDWATSLDIKAAFNHIRLHASFRPYLCFSHRGVFYAYNSMPFGCRHSPRIFTRALSFAMAYIRVHWSVRVCAYMDDILLLHQDREYLRLATLQIAGYLRSLGWTLALDKCEFTPEHVIRYLGWRWDFLHLTLSMTSAMRSTLLLTLDQWIRKAQTGERVTSRALGSVIGCLNFLRCQIPRASLYLRTSHSLLARAVNSTGWNGSTILSRAIVSELLWWRRNVWYNTPYDFRSRDPQALLITDASKTGWGAVLFLGGQSFVSFGFFSTEDGLTSSNQRETTAVLRALIYFRSRLRTDGVRALQLKTDNMVTVFNLQRQGASGGKLLEATRAIFSLLTRLDMRIYISHVPGVENVFPDALSRMDVAGDYELTEEAYQRGVAFLRVRPTIDLFASASNKKIERFCSLPTARVVEQSLGDAWMSPWTGETPYVFPPIQLMARVLQKLKRDAVKVAVVVFPVWPCQPWWNLLRAMTTSQSTIVLGPTSVNLKRGPSLTSEHKLPPGSIAMARLFCG